MKIAVWHNLPSGGGMRALYYHVKGLAQRGHTIKVWRPPTADAAYLPLHDYAEEEVIPLAPRQSAPRLPLLYELASYRNHVAALSAMDEHSKVCAAQMAAEGFDVLFGNACMYYRATAIARYSNLPSAIYLQEPFRWLYEAMPKLPWLALPPWSGSPWAPRRALRVVGDLMMIQRLRVQAREELRNAAAYNMILVNSLYSRESVLRAYGIDARVCYLGVDDALFVDQKRTREPFVVGIGAFVPEKNIEFIIDAVGAIAEQRPSLVWIGNVSDPDHLMGLRRRAAARQVEFQPLVRISDAEVVATLNAATAMVYAPRLEPFGFAPLEANACATPVVAVSEGGVRETVTDGVNGVLVPHEVPAMAAAIEKLLRNPALARELGVRGRQVVQTRWSLNAAIDRLEAELYQVAESPFREKVHAL